MTYLYIRTSEYYSQYDACKLGITKDIHTRDSQYVTGEIKRGTFSHIFKIKEERYDLKTIESKLQESFKNKGLHVYHDGGTEFFKLEIIDLIENELKDMEINYEKIDFKEIERPDVNRLHRSEIKQNDVNRLYHLQLLSEKLNNEIDRLKLLLANDDIKTYFEPKDYQQPIINKTILDLKQNRKAILNLICGTGKTFISLYSIGLMGLNKILIGVPNQTILDQWTPTIKCIRSICNYPILKINKATQLNDIQTFLDINKDRYILITTYHSSNKIVTLKVEPEIKILDEVHHITKKSKNNDRTYGQILNIKSYYQLSLSATLKTKDDTISQEYISNLDSDHFGEISYSLSLTKAIENNIVCDYEIKTLMYDELSGNKLVNIALLAKYCIENNISKHLLIYTNTIKHSEKIISYIKPLLKNTYCNTYTGRLDNNHRKEVLSDFQASETGILSCVYALGEGFDLPILDSVLFGERMSAKTRIIQSALRPCRKFNGKTNANIILPVYIQNWDDNKNNPNDMTRNIILELSSVDENLYDKIKVSSVKKEGNEYKTLNSEHNIYEEQFKNELKSWARSELTIQVCKKIIKQMGGANTIQKYTKLCDKNIKLPREPDIFFGSNWKGWIDYLNIDISQYYDLETCKRKVQEYLNLYPEIIDPLNLVQVCNYLCEKDDKFPPTDKLWTEEVYKQPLKHIIILPSSKKKSKGIII